MDRCYLWFSLDNDYGGRKTKIFHRKNFSLKNLKERAFSTAEGIYETCFNVAGLAFQTPEALMRDCHFRSVTDFLIFSIIIDLNSISVWIHACIEHMGYSKSR